MTKESTPRVQEEPSTHRRRMQVYAGAALGAVAVVLLIATIVNIWNNKERRAPQKETAEVVAPVGSDRQSQFSELAKNRPGRVATDPVASNDDALSQFDKIAAGMPPEKTGNRRSAQDRQGRESEPGESEESKAVRQYKAREELRALQAANTKWSLPKEGKNNSPSPMSAPGSSAPMRAGAGTPGNIQDQIAHMNRPMDENASLEERRAEVKRRIAEAQKLRQSLQQNGAAGLPEAAARPTSNAQPTMPTMATPVAAQESSVPSNVVGFPKKNTYKATEADREGMIKVPPGTEITTTLMKKGISDYTNSSLKAIANRDVYDISRRYVIIPKGTEFNVRMVRTRNVNEAISNRVGFLVKDAVLPSGDSIDFSTASVADREGVGAIQDQTDYHIMAQFLGVAAYALIGQTTSRSGTGEDESTYAGDVGENSRSQFAPLAEKYLNIVPTQTIRPGQSFQIVTEQEMFIKPWSDLYAKYVN